MSRTGCAGGEAVPLLTAWRRRRLLRIFEGVYQLAIYNDACIYILYTYSRIYIYTYMSYIIVLSYYSIIVLYIYTHIHIYIYKYTYIYILYMYIYDMLIICCIYIYVYTWYVTYRDIGPAWSQKPKSIRLQCQKIGLQDTSLQLQFPDLFHVQVKIFPRT